MKKSVRAMRIDRRHKRMQATAKLSLVSLMDIFTILVFFLMVNASSVQVLQNDKSIALPKSVSEQTAKENLVILVNATDLVIQGRKVADIRDIYLDESTSIASLATELQYQRSRETALSAAEPDQSVTIMGDKKIPYKLLKKIMKTCADEGFIDISLAVEQIHVDKNKIMEAQ